MHVFLRRFPASAFLLGLTLSLAACGGGGGSPQQASTAILPPQSSSTRENTRAASTTALSNVSAVSTPASAAAAPNPCTIVPVKNVEVSTASLTLAPNTSGQFQACTQFSGPFTITASTKGVVSFISPVNVTVLPNTIKAATITITAGAADGTTTLTVTDKKGMSARVTVTVVATLSLTCPGFGNAGGTAVACTVMNPGYNGTYTFTGSTNTCTTVLSGFKVSDTAAEGCKVTLTPTSGSQAAVQVTIQFVGPLGLNCPTPAQAGATGVSCTVTNANYSGGYNPPSTNSGTCSAGALSNGSFTLTDSAGENCTVTLTPSSGSESSSQATVTFVGPLTLNCPPTAAVGATGASCTYGNPGYAGDYKFAATAGGCKLNASTDTTLTITDASAESCTITFTPQSGPETAAQVTIAFEGPLTLNCPSAAATGNTGATCTYAYPGYSGAFAASTVSGSCTVPATPTGGSFAVTDATDETCTVQLAASADGGLSSPQTAQIAFSTQAGGAGPLALNCPSTMVFVNGTPAVCTYTNPGYPSTDGYSVGTSTGCQSTTQPGNGPSGSVAIQATTLPVACKVTLTPTSTTVSEPAASATTNFINGGGGGGGGGSCSVIKHGKGNNKRTPFAVNC